MCHPRVVSTRAIIAINFKCEAVHGDVMLSFSTPSTPIHENVKPDTTKKRQRIDGVENAACFQLGEVFFLQW